MSGWRVYAILYLLFLYLPIALLPLFAFNDSQIIAFPLKGFTTKWFGQLAELPELRAALGNSLLIAVISAVLATTFGVFAARASTRFAFPGRRPLMGLIMAPLVLPEIIVAVSLLIVIVQLLGGAPGRWAVIAAHTLICIPFSVAILNGAFEGMDPSFEEASIDLGESRFSTFRLITLPLVAPGIVSSLLISFTISLDEFIIAFFLSGSEATLPVYIYGLLRFPARIPVVMALGTILVALSILILFLAERFRRRAMERSGQTSTGVIGT